MKRWTIALAALICCGAVAHTREPQLAAGTIATAHLPYLPGSIVPITADGLRGALRLSSIGDATIDGSSARLSAPGSATIVASNAGGLAMHTFAIAAPPSGERPFIAVASYDDGIVFHRTEPPFEALGVLGIGGAAAAVAVGPNAQIASADTDGTTATLARVEPWSVRTISGVADADELAFDPLSGNLFVTDRDVDGAGALTRIAPDGSVTRRILGLTSEGIAIDARRGLVYVANTNDGTVSVVDAATLVERRRFKAVPRIFSIALSRDGSRLYTVSNQSLDSPFASAGGVAAFDVARGDRRIASSPALRFPVGIALDERSGRVFVTDESDDVVDVLDARTLRPAHAALATCTTPWQPAIDQGRLYVPCARSNEVDVFDTRSLARVAGAPFATGGYPLAVAVWHP